MEPGNIRPWSKNEDELICVSWMESRLWMKSGVVTTEREAVLMSLLWKRVNDTLVVARSLPRPEKQFQNRWIYLLGEMESFTTLYKLVQQRYPSSIAGDYLQTLATAKSLFKDRSGH